MCRQDFWPVSVRGSQQLYHRCRHGRSDVSIFITLWKNEAILSRADKNPACMAVNPPTLSEKVGASMFLSIVDISSVENVICTAFHLLFPLPCLRKLSFFFVFVCVCVCVCVCVDCWF